jgi:hypothetical protein
LVHNYDGAKLRYPLPPDPPALIMAIDGHRSLVEIHAALGAKAGPYDRFKADFDLLYTALNAGNLMFLRYPPSRK